MTTRALGVVRLGYVQSSSLLCRQNSEQDQRTTPTLCSLAIIAAQQMQITELTSTKAENAQLKAQLAEILARLEQLEKTGTAQR